MPQSAIQVKLDAEGRSATIDATSKTAIKEVVETYLVTYATALEFVDDLFDAAVSDIDRIPQVDAPYANDSELLAKAFSHEQLDDGRLAWRVFVTYKNESVSTGLGVSGGSPTDENWEVVWRARPVRRFTEDAYEFEEQDPFVPTYLRSNLVSTTKRFPIDNANEDLYEPQPYDEYDMYGTFEKKITSFDPKVAKDFIGKVNTDSLSIGGMSVDPFQGKVVDYHVGKKLNQAGVNFYPLTIVVGVRKGTWALKLGNQGFRYKDVNGAFHQFSTDGQVAQKPQWLRKDGTKAAPAGTEGPEGERLYIRFLIEEHIKFGELKLPRDLP